MIEPTVCRFRVGDKVRLTKVPLGFRDKLNAGQEGFIACISAGQKTQVRVGVDFGFRLDGFNRLAYYAEDGTSPRALETPTGCFVFQSYLELAGPPDDGGDWI